MIGPGAAITNVCGLNLYEPGRIVVLNSNRLDGGGKIWLNRGQLNVGGPGSLAPVTLIVTNSIIGDGLVSGASIIGNGCSNMTVESHNRLEI